MDKVQDSTSHRKPIVETTTMVTTYFIEHLLQPTKVQTMIQDFMATFSKDMSPLEDNIVMHNATLEGLIYRKIRSLCDQLEVWTTYLRDKIS